MFSPIYANFLELSYVLHKKKGQLGAQIWFGTPTCPTFGTTTWQTGLYVKTVRCVASSAVVSSMWTVNIFSTYIFFLFY